MEIPDRTTSDTRCVTNPVAQLRRRNSALRPAVFTWPIEEICEGSNHQDCYGVVRLPVGIGGRARGDHSISTCWCLGLEPGAGEGDSGTAAERRVAPVWVRRRVGARESRLHDADGNTARRSAQAN